MKPYLSVCAIYRWSADYLREWVEFHRLVGVDRFFLYNNNSDDAHREALAPYLEDGSVILHDWPSEPGQKPAYEHCLVEHRDDSRWIAFIDSDEFLFSPTGRPVPELLVDYERWPGVGVNRVNFGPSGHRTRPSGLVIENYTVRLHTPRDRQSVKSIVDPKRAVAVQNPHCFRYEGGSLAVDENQQPIEDWIATSFTVSQLRVNHYLTKSIEEYGVKRQRPRAGPKQDPPGWVLEGLEREDAASDERDETILAYLPALRRALAARESAAPPRGAASIPG